MYAGAIRCIFSASSPMLVFVHPVIRIPGRGGFAFGAGLHSVRSESFAAVIFGLPFPAVSTYTVISRCSRCVFSSKRSINKLFSISNPTLSGGGSGLEMRSEEHTSELQSRQYL